MAMRHSLGHIFISCWTVVDGNNRALPRWMFVGAAHWLCKLQERFRDDVTFCGNESQALTGSGKKWEEDCAKLARTGKFTPIEELFGKTASGQLTLEDHKRAWAYFHFGLAEWREPFAKALPNDTAKSALTAAIFILVFIISTTPRNCLGKIRSTVTANRTYAIYPVEL